MLFASLNNEIIMDSHQPPTTPLRTAVCTHSEPPCSCSCCRLAVAAALCCSIQSCIRAISSVAGCSCSMLSAARLNGSVADDSKWRSIVDLHTTHDTQFWSHNYKLELTSHCMHAAFTVSQPCRRLHWPSPYTALALLARRPSQHPIYAVVLSQQQRRSK